MALLSLRNITLAFGGPPVLDGLSLQIESGDRLCLLGRNGAGKSTLLQVISGAVRPDSGEILRSPGLRVAMVSQHVPGGLSGAVFDMVAAGMGNAADLLAEHHRVSHLLAEDPTPDLLARLGDLQKSLEECDGWSLHHEVERVLSRLSIDPDAEFSSLSGGTKRRVLLARALVLAPAVLLLDEPTNQLDIETIEWLEEFLLRESRTAVFVTHDRAFARRIATRVAELDRGRLYSFDCGYDAFVQRREALLDAEIERVAQLDRKLAQEEAWLRKGIKARRTRNEGRVRALLALREERLRQRERSGQVRMQIAEVERSGKLVAAAEEVSFDYGGRPIIRNLTTTIVRGDKVGIIGRNGSGKTTLLRLLLGELKPVSGSIRLGSRLGILYFDQLREELDLERSIAENVCETGDTVIIDGEARHIIGYLQDFLFTAEQARTPAKALSGGERNRVLLARLFARPCSVLAMDEPTNDLDAETLDLLENLILEYSGTLLLVSHDREFLNNAVTSTLALSDDGTVRECVGGYDDWLRLTQAEEAAARASRAAPLTPPQKQRPAPDRPRKLTYKEARELESLPEAIAALEAEQAKIHATLAAPETYREGGSRVTDLNTRLGEVDAAIEAAYVRWDELETLRAAQQAEKG